VLIRLDHELELQRVVFDGKIFLAPIDPNAETEYHVLDIGTGTGKWAVEFGKLYPLLMAPDMILIEQATEYPNSKVIGTDLSLMNYERYHHHSRRFQRNSY
jgi:ubiquinone/menaquinone biosynthesis C-methylase UbiE